MVAQKIKSPHSLAIRFARYKHNKENRYLSVEKWTRQGDKYTEKVPKPMSIAGFCLYLGIGMQTWGRFCKSERVHAEGFEAVIDKIKTEIRKDQLEGSMVGIYNANIAMRLNGLSDTQIIKKQKLPPPSPITKIHVIHPDSYKEEIAPKEVKELGSK